MRLTFVSLVACAVVVVRGAVVGKRILYQHAQDIPRGWRLDGRASSNESMTLSIELKQPGIAELKSRLSRISDPDHPEYGFHLSRDELKGYQTPDKKALKSITSWLEENRVRGARVTDSSITFTTTVSSVNEMLGTKVDRYSFEGSTTPYFRARSYSAPTSLSEQIEFIHPLSHFAPPVRSRAKPQDILTRSGQMTQHSRQDQPCASGVTPSCLHELYKVPMPDAQARPETSQVRLGIGGFLDQWIHHQDVNTFLETHLPALQAAGYNFSVALVNNGTNPQTPATAAGIEASLDVQYALAMAYPTNVVYYSTGGRGAKLDADGHELPEARSDNEPYLVWLQYLLDLPDAEMPHVLSISYADDEQSVPAAYARRVCDLFAQLAARGVTALAATGDAGAQGTGLMACYSNDGGRRRAFIPTFPASCPYVTSVGATGHTLPLQGASFSAGGFSNYFRRPGWQDGAVGSYVAAMNGSHAGLYNESGRAMPDVSAAGTSYAVVAGGREISVLGTSASTPVVAAFVARANDARLKAGRSTIGWLNPLLYSPAVVEALEDVVGGASQGCTFGTEREPGFVATEGYDCVVGLGSVRDFGRLMEALG